MRQEPTLGQPVAPGQTPAETGNTLGDRDFRFATEQYTLFFNRVTGLQGEREIWIRHSIIATFAFFGWIAVYRDNVTDTFMLEMVQLQAIYFVPLIFNLGGALRFFVIQRDINRLVHLLIGMEADVLRLSPVIREYTVGRGVRDRHWHAPSICYWIFIIAFSAGAAAMLTL